MTERPLPFEIEPSLTTHALYLVGWDETRGAIRTFKIERMRDVSLLPQSFPAPDEDVIAHLNAGLQTQLGPTWPSAPAAASIPTMPGYRGSSELNSVIGPAV